MSESIIAPSRLFDGLTGVIRVERDGKLMTLSGAQEVAEGDHVSLAAWGATDKDRGPQRAIVATLPKDKRLPPAVMPSLIVGGDQAVWLLREPLEPCAEGYPALDAFLASVSDDQESSHQDGLVWSDKVDGDGRVYGLEELPLKVWNDACVWGELDGNALAQEVEICSAADGPDPKQHGVMVPYEAGGKRLMKPWRPHHKDTIESLIDFLSHHYVGEKEGYSIISGKCADGARQANTMIHCDTLMLDVDSGMPRAELLEKVRAEGVLALVWTTHSHMKTVTKLNKTKVQEHAKATDRNPTLEECLAFMQRDGAEAHPSVLEGATLVEEIHDGAGLQISVHHKPWPKHRVVFFLKDRVIFAKRKVHLPTALREWSDKVRGMAERIGATIDKVAVDCSRLMYTPRHVQGREYAIDIFPGVLLDYDSIPVVDSTDPFAKVAGEMAENDGDPLGKLFLKKYGEWFDHVMFFEDHCEKGNSGQMLCPFNEGHNSNPGSRDDAGFYAKGEPGDRALVGCSHNACGGRVNGKCDPLRYIMQVKEDKSLSWGQMGEYVAEQGNFDPTLFGGTREAEPVGTFANDGEANAAIDALTPLSGNADCEKVIEGLLASDMDRTKVRMLVRGIAHRTKRRIPDVMEMVREAERISRNQRPDTTDPEEVFKYMQRRGYAKVRWGKDVVYADTTLDVIVPYSLGSMEQEYHNTVSMYQTKPVKYRNWFKEWSVNKDARSYDMPVFRPGGYASPRQLNLWRGFPVEGVKGDWSLLRQHIFENICRGDVEHFAWLVCWMAQIVQRPWEKLGTAVVLRGKKGTGKTKLAEWFSELMPHNSAFLDNPEDLFGGFNVHMAYCLFVCGEEAFWAGSKSQEGKFKNMITGKKQMLHPKGFDRVPIDDYRRFMILSNEDWIVPATQDERRFFVLDVGDTRMQVHAYFAAIDEQMENGGLEAFMYDLQHVVIPECINLRKPPKTAALTDQAEHSSKPQEAWWTETLRAGHLMLPHDGLIGPETPMERRELIEEDWPEDGDPLHVEKKRLYESYRRFYVQERRIGKLLTPSQFGKFLADVCPGLVEHRPNGEPREHVLPEIGGLRTEWTKRTGIRFGGSSPGQRPTPSELAEWEGGSVPDPGDPG